jgi:3-oxoacyl-[acyl-carrier protein] reductase
MYPELKGKTAIVTGAGRGIGAEIAQRLAKEGARVVVNYSLSSEAALNVVRAIEKEGATATAVVADVSKVSDVVRLFDETEKAYGPADILINNAGVILYKPIAEVTEKEFDDLFAINVKGTFFGCQQAARRLRSGGSIVNFSSSTTALMLPTYGTYVATKGAVEQLTHVLAKELGARKIRVNIVSPGPVETELFLTGKSEADIARNAAMNAFGRLGKPEDIAKAVLFLVSDQAGWITGQNIRANGGLI